MITDEDPIFKVSSPSRLFFQNTRSHLYQLVSQKNGRIDYYYWKEQSKDSPIDVVIADNWLAEEAYLLLNFNEDLLEEEWTITNSDEVIFNNEPSTNRAHYDTALNIYRALQDGDSLYIRSGDESIELFPEEADRANFKVIVKDYLRLIEKR